jgi:hypothetical protein
VVSHVAASQPTQSELVSIIDQVVSSSTRFLGENVHGVNFSLLGITIQDIANFKESTNSIAPKFRSQVDDEKSESSVSATASVTSYLNEIKNRFDFLNYILLKSPSINVSFDHVNLLWRLCVEQARVLGERDIFLDWLVDLCNASPHNQESTSAPFRCVSSTCAELVASNSRFCPSCGTRQSHAGASRLPQELVHFVFEKCVVGIDRHSMTPATFRCFQSLFIIVNSPATVERDSLPMPPLKGMDLLWEMCLGVTSKAVNRTESSVDAAVEIIFCGSHFKLFFFRRS